MKKERINGTGFSKHSKNKTLLYAICTQVYCIKVIMSLFSLGRADKKHLESTLSKYSKWVGELSKQSTARIESCPFFTKSGIVEDFQRGSTSRFKNMPEQIHIEVDPSTVSNRDLNLNDMSMVFLPNLSWKGDPTQWSPLGNAEILSSKESLHETLTKEGQSVIIKIPTNFPYITNKYEFNYNTKLGIINATKTHPIIPYGSGMCHDVMKMDPTEKHDMSSPPIHIPHIGHTFSNNIFMPHADQGVWVLIYRQSLTYATMLSFIAEIYYHTRSVYPLLDLIDTRICSVRHTKYISYNAPPMEVTNRKIDSLHMALEKFNREYQFKNIRLADEIMEEILAMAEQNTFDSF